MKTSKVWVGVAFYDHAGRWLGSFPMGADIPQDVLDSYVQMEVEARVNEEESS